MGCAVVDFAWQQQLLLALLLLLPFTDKQWQLPVISRYELQWVFWSVIIVPAVLLIALNPEYSEAIIIIFLFTATPEEWFFRAYFLQRLEALTFGKWTANIITSLMFAFMHTPVQGWLGLSVFVPSLMFGWLYQRNRDLILVILLHALFNAIFLLYIRDILADL